MTNTRYLSDIDVLPGFVEKNGRSGKMKITKEGNLWVISYSNFKELRSFNTSFSETMDDIISKIRSGNFEYKR